MLLLKDLTTYLNEFIDPDKLEDYAPTGLQVEGSFEVKKIATAVSASLETIEKAVEAKADALIVHHGLFWKGDAFPLVGSKKRKIKALIENNLSLFAYHLPLDAHREVGNNWKAAQDLGWKNLTPFGYIGKSPIGVRGTFSPMPVAAFIAELEAYYGHGAMRAEGGEPIVSSAALISGGAYKELKAAAEVGVDCFITGNFDEPAWAVAHEESIHFFALGHSATERVGVRALAEHLEEKMQVPTEFLDIFNPF